MQFVHPKQGLELPRGFASAPIRTDHDARAELFAQRAQPFDRFAVPVMVDRREVVLVHAQIGLIVKPVRQGATQLLQIMLEPCLHRGRLQNAIDVEEDDYTS